jgi:hypothetical protein
VRVDQNTLETFGGAQKGWTVRVDQNTLETFGGAQKGWTEVARCLTSSLKTGVPVPVAESTRLRPINLRILSKRTNEAITDIILAPFDNLRVHNRTIGIRATPQIIVALMT